VIALARHGRTAFNAERRFQGQLPVPLDEVGRRQAQELARNAEGGGFAVLWCSPLRRARETAEAVAGRLGLEPREDARFMETHTGDWTGRSFAEVQAEEPELFAAFERFEPAFRFPGGESYAEQGQRVLEALAEVGLGELPALVVCHRGVIRLALGGGPRPVGNGEIVPLPPAPWAAEPSTPQPSPQRFRGSWPQFMSE
jgi:broad specificity phosphatase PhoE